MKQAIKLIKRFLPYYKGHGFVMAADLGCAAVTTVCELILPMMVRYLTGVATEDIAALTARTVLTIGGFYIALRVVDALAEFYKTSAGHIMGTRMETEMRRDLFAHLHELPFTFFDNTKVGQIISRITTDLFEVTEFAHHCPEEFFIAGLKLIVSFFVLASINIPLTLIMFAALPIMLVGVTFFNRKLQNAFRKSRVQTGEINARVEDSLLGVRVVKSFANEEVENKKFEKDNEKFFDIKKETYTFMGGFHGVNRVFDGAMYASMLIFGGLFMLKGSITVADFTAYMLYISMLIAAIRRVVEFNEQFLRGVTGIERFIEIIDLPVEQYESKNAVDMTDVKGDVSFEHVSFRYEKDNELVLDDVCLNVEHGKKIALVGPSGSGKTTLCNLLPRFYEPTSGIIKIDGRDIREFSLHSLRDSIGVVQQDVYMFSGTVLENIAYGRDGATRGEVVEAAKRAGAHEFITRLPNGYDTYIGERGLKLSGGQKQRLSIARVFVKNPPILILDEATSALDNQSEMLVQQSLVELARGRTTFTVAHRLTTIKNADVILVLKDNRIVESGTHAQLLAKRGEYFELYSMYYS